MTHDEILALPIQDIEEREHSDNSIIIQFTIHGTLFYFHIKKIQYGPLFPRGVYHSDFSTPHKQTFFDQLSLTLEERT